MEFHIGVDRQNLPSKVCYIHALWKMMVVRTLWSGSISSSLINFFQQIKGWIVPVNQRVDPFKEFCKMLEVTLPISSIKEVLNDLAVGDSIATV